MLPNEKNSRMVWVDDALHYGKVRLTNKELRHSTGPLENADKLTVRSYRHGNKGQAHKVGRDSIGAIALAEFNEYIEAIDLLDA